MTCQTRCGIYLISCKTCHLQYVGQTKNSIRDRLNGHRGHILRGTEAFVMQEHFAGEQWHVISNMIIKLIEQCDVNVINVREKYWIKELNTIFPYGLNMDSKYSKIKNSYDFVTSNN